MLVFERRSYLSVTLYQDLRSKYKDLDLKLKDKSNYSNWLHSEIWLKMVFLTLRWNSIISVNSWIHAYVFAESWPNTETHKSKSCIQKDLNSNDEKTGKITKICIKVYTCQHQQLTFHKMQWNCTRFHCYSSDLFIFSTV